MMNWAISAASGGYSWDPAANLRVRGYRVRVGTGTVSSRIADSNAYGAKLHIALHSNAPGGTYSCTSTSTSGKGTMVMYYGSSSQRLAGLIKTEVGDSSPGTSDKICTDTTCSGQSLGELRSTKAVSAYAEIEYHTWNNGVSWIRNTYYAWHLGQAVDEYLGYPRG
jgi:hypothetical protein